MLQDKTSLGIVQYVTSLEGRPNVKSNEAACKLKDFHQWHTEWHIVILSCVAMTDLAPQLVATSVRVCVLHPQFVPAVDQLAIR